MKSFVLAALAALVFIPSAVAQIGIVQGVIEYGTRLVVVNDTADQSICSVEIDGANRGSWNPGESKVAYHYNGGLIQMNTGYNRRLSVTIKVCSDAREIENFYAAPNWALDTRIVGDKADLLSDAFLKSNPPEDAVAKRVETLKKALDGRRLMGRAEMKKMIDGWHSFIKKHGVIRTETVCARPIAIGATVDLQADNYRRSQTATLYIRGARGNYTASYQY